MGYHLHIFPGDIRVMRNPQAIQSWTIFNSLHEALKENELKKLRLAKCSRCGRSTPYRLKSLEMATVRCRRCGNSIQVKVKKPY